MYCPTTKLCVPIVNTASPEVGLYVPVVGVNNVLGIIVSSITPVAGK